MTICLNRKEQKQFPQEKMVLDYMEMCLVYDMEFSYSVDAREMYVLYTSAADGDYAQIYFDNDIGVITQAFIDWDGGVKEFSSEDSFYETLEEARKDFLQQVYSHHGLIEHPRSRLKRRGDYSEALSCLMEAVKRRCDISFLGDIIKIITTREDQPRVEIAIALERGMYKIGMLRRRGITINVPDLESMLTILEYLEL